jgi:aspartyl-tRNA(Asn)/glutamyl-tRNA(Gln) amidotransferase subunit A
MRPNTVVVGNLARSVRDAARYYDVCAGTHLYDPTSLPSTGGWEAGLGSYDLRGKRVAIVPALGGVTLEPGVEDRLRATAKELLAATGMVEVDVTVAPPNLAAQWMMGNLSTLRADLGDRWPRCAPLLTNEVAVGLRLAQSMYNLDTAAAAERLRIEANETMARAFEQADFIIAATNPGPAFPADAAKSASEDSFVDWAASSDIARYLFRGALFGVRLASTLAPRLPAAILDAASKRFPELVNMGALTIISNIYGNPAVSIPAGTVGGLPVGMQVLAPHHADALLFDVALAYERAVGWPLVAPTLAASQR